MINPSSQTFLNQRESDTATPRDMVPVFFVHSTTTPFCLNPDCECHQNQQQIYELLVAIGNGEMTLKEASNFSDGLLL